MPTNSYDFNGANGDPLPSGLTAENGTFEIQDNRLRGSGSSPGGGVFWLAVESAASDADATVTATIRGDAGAGSTAGIIFRYSSNDELWMAACNFSAGNVRLFKRTGGSWSAITDAGSVSTETDHVLSATLSGNDIDISLDGTPIISVTDSHNATAARHGVRLGTSQHSADDLSVVWGAADTVAPILSSPSGASTGETTASGSVSTDEANGTLDAVVTTSSTTPSAAQIQAGQDHTGASAAASDLDNAVSATGTQNVSFTGLTASTTYYVHFVHQDAAGNDSTAVSSASFTTDAAASGTVSVGEAYASNCVYQRGATVTFTGTYTGSPTALQYRVMDGSDDSEIATWATFDASPSGGTFSLTFTPPTSTAAMYVEVRFSNDTGVTDAQTTDWRYGIRGLIYGQSLAENLESQDAITPPSAYIYYNGTNFVSPTTGRGLNALATLLINMYGCSVCLTSTAVSGTEMTFEANSSSNHWASATSTIFSDTVTRVSGMTNGDDLLEFALFIQGDRDATLGVDEQTYFRINDVGGLGSLLTNSRENWSYKDGSTLPIVLGILGRKQGSGTDYQAIRNAHLHMGRADDNVYPLPIYHHGTDDGQHPNDAGDTAIGEDTAVLVALINGDISTNCPDIVSAEINAGATEITLEFDTDLLTSDTTYSTEGVRVEDGGVAATVTAFARETARKAKITVSSSITNTDNIDVYLAYGVGSTSNALSYPRSADITLPNSAGTHSLPALNAKIDLVELAG